MRKRKPIAACAVLLLCALLLTGCKGVSEMSSLRELSRPYVGEYRCERLLLAGEDVLPAFRYVRLALAYDGEARLYWERAEGGEGEYRLRYTAQPDEGRIVFYAQGASRTFPLEEGSVRLGIQAGGRYLYAQFKM